MPFSSGTYTGLANSFNDAVSGTVIDPLDWNDLFTDIEGGINALLLGTTGASVLITPSQVTIGTNPTTWAALHGVAATARLIIEGGASANMGNLTYGASASPGTVDATNGYTGFGVTMYTTTNMTSAANVAAVVGSSVRNAGKNGIATGGLFTASNSGTWTHDVTDGGVVALQSTASTSRGGTIFALNSNLNVTSTTGALARIVEFDSNVTVTAQSKYGVILVSTSTDAGTISGTNLSNSGRTLIDGGAIDIVAVSNGSGGGGSGWPYGIIMFAPAGATAQPVYSTGSLFLADGFNVARGLDWYTVSFSDHAIGLGNTQVIAWRNAANSAFINGIALNASNAVVLGASYATFASATSATVGSWVLGTAASYATLGDGTQTVITSGPVGDAQTFYDNTTHRFRNRAAGATFATLTSSGFGLFGSSTGTATIVAQATAGTPTLTLPNASGTFAVSASSPLSLSATTGALTIAGSALTKTDDTNVTLTLGGTPATSLLVAASLTLGWTGTLAVARGGIGVGTLASNGALYGNGTGAVLATAQGGANTVLVANSGAPSFSATVKIGTSLVVGSGNAPAFSSTIDCYGRCVLGSGTSSGDSEQQWRNYSDVTKLAWTCSVRQDVGGANGDLKILRYSAAGAFQDIPVQIATATGLVTMIDGIAVTGGTITDTLRINATPSAVGTGAKTISNAADSSTNFGHYAAVNMNGTTYYFPCSATAPT